MNTVKQIALSDISKYLRETHNVDSEAQRDIFIILPKTMAKDKEITLLNKRLGLHKVNKHGTNKI